MLNFTPETPVLILGISESLGSTHAALMKRYGTHIVAGVSPGCGGKTLHGIPIFDLVEQAQQQVGAVEIATICVHPYLVLDAALEAIAAGIRQLILLTEGMPPLDVVRLLRKAEDTETLVVGPSSPGIIVPGKVLLGTHPQQLYTPGAVGLIGCSGTLTYEIASTLTQAGLGQSIALGIGGDAIVGSSFSQWLQILDEDESTEAIVLVLEIGTGSEEITAEYIEETIDKPVIVYMAGRYAPKVRKLGHAGAIVTSHLSRLGRSTLDPSNLDMADPEIEAFRSAQIPVAHRPSEIPLLVKQAIEGQ